VSCSTGWFFNLGAFRACGAEPGYPLVSFARRSKGYRFYPLRESKPLRGFDFAEFHGGKQNL
jgi:hypothetical protein